MLDDATLKRLWANRAPAGGHPDEVRWERLMCDALPAEERTAVLAHVTSCAACARVYRALLHLDEEVRANDPALPGRRTARPGPRPWLWGGLAAAAVLVLAARVTWYPPPPGAPVSGATPLATTPDVSRGGSLAPGPHPVVDLGIFAPPPYEPMALRGSSAEQEARFDAAMALYRAGDCAGAQPLLSESADLDADDPTPLFFLGVCQLLEGNLPAGRASLRHVVSLGDTPYLEEAHFYLAKGHLLAGDSAHALEELERVLELEGNLEQEARALQRALARLR